MADQDPNITPSPSPASDTSAASPKEGAPVAQPAAIDEAALAEKIAKSLKDSFVLPASAAPAPEPRPVSAADPVGDLMRPYIEKATRGVSLEAQAAKDYADFYIDHPEARKHKESIEKTFEALFSAGTPFTRKDIWFNHRGRPENFEKSVNEEIESRRKKAEEAAANSGVPIGSPPAARTVAKDPYSATPDELTKALENVTF